MTKKKSESKTEKKAAPKKPDAITHVVVDGTNRLHGDDALEGGFVKVTGGEHEGRVGVFLTTEDFDKDGRPKTVLVRTRDDRNEMLTVPYKDVSATKYTGGR